MIPDIGFGTYKLDNFDMIEQSYYYEYKHIDTAQLYKNEHIVGDKIKNFRNDIFITTKLLWKYDKEKDIIRSIEKSFENLQTNYIDLFLIHNPNKNMIMQYKCLEYFYPKVIKNIGISNFNEKDIENILENCSVKPICNQIEITPFCQKDSLTDFCFNNKIDIVAHSSLSNKKFFENKLIKQLELKYKKTPAQILLKWSLQQNFKIIPKTNNINHLKENINLNFKIDDQDIIDMNKLKQENFLLFR